jgi:hypothetical protein
VSTPTPAAWLLIAVLQPFAAWPAQADSGDKRTVHSFSTSRCKTDACFAKHPSGTYVHPNQGSEHKRHD